MLTIVTTILPCAYENTNVCTFVLTTVVTNVNKHFYCTYVNAFVIGFADTIVFANVI